MKTTQSKTTKPIPASATEECGVWLDAGELRAKKPKKRLTRPISKLLNPLAQSGGYSMAVALSFTQTKLQMPAAKQSTISSFFPPQSKMSKDTEERGTPSPSKMSFTSLPQAHVGTKRKREMTFELSSEPSKDTRHISLVHPQDSHVDFKREADEFCKDREKEKHFFHLIWGCQSEDLEPAEKRRRPENIIIENVTVTQKECNKAKFDGCKTIEEIKEIPETLLQRHQVQQDSYVHSNQIHKSSFRANQDGSLAYNSVKGFQSQKPFRPSIQRAVFTTRSITETQNTAKHPSKAYKRLELCEQNHHYIRWAPVKTMDKENSRSTSPLQYVKHLPLKQQFSPSPAKLFSDFKVKYCRSPKKSVNESLGDEGDSLAMLFTQDSEGFRVIANRSKWVRCPLKDCTNSTEGIDYSDIPKPMEREENTDLEPEMLFTKDSQGNMVIKH
ncbi:hypothetical protein P4O66_019499 [Electrophorus voltai]|uniref:Aurora kinase A and ninein-interacting protein n=1 Tax=Electrophorus voltai TaxID=2609070 RepID=A0AAD8ZTT2_9TELE|nr:hypothetical protein P4O66_019499 [Electrophorus voltai]